MVLTPLGAVGIDVAHGYLEADGGIRAAGVREVKRE